MLKRLLSVGIALPATIVGLVIYWIVFMPWLRIPGVSPWGKLFLAVVELAAGIYLFVRWRSLPALLLLVGSIPMLLFNISYVGWNWRMQRLYGSPSLGDDPRLAFLFPSDNEYSPTHRFFTFRFCFGVCRLRFSGTSSELSTGIAPSAPAPLTD
jgi:hypothetical protein